MVIFQKKLLITIKPYMEGVGITFGESDERTNSIKESRGNGEIG
ncbi:hypothetical protein VDIAB_110519 [Vibrio diabolicus]|nr:hypothetical protein VDIAB_110519 [Vibrio diabolicus]